LYKPKTEFLLCGDISINYLHDSNRKKYLSYLLTTYDLSHTVDFATRTQNKSSTAIDNIFVDSSRLGSTIISPLINGLSDHDAQLPTINSIYAAIQNVFVKQKNIKTLTNFQSLLQQETWQTVYQTQDTNNMFNSFLNTFLHIFETSFPTNHRSAKNKNAGITQGIRISCKQKRSLNELTKNSNDPKAKPHYITYCTILKTVIKEAKKKTIL